MMPENRKKKIYKGAVAVLSAAIIIVLLFTFIPRLTGSSGGAPMNNKNLASGFSCTVKANCDDTDYEVNLTKPSNGDYTVTFVKPESLNELSFQKTSEGIKIKRGALELVVDPSTIPQKSIYDAVSGVFESCINKDVKVKKQGNDTVISGTSSAGDYKMTFGSDMKPKSFSIPSINLNAEISNFKTQN